MTAKISPNALNVNQWYGKMLKGKAATNEPFKKHGQNGVGKWL